MVKQTKVICTTVGPYAKYGSNLVEACVEHGVDYCDLTGEVQWIRRMVDKHQAAAKYAKHIKLRVKVMKGGMSGGTYASLNHVMAEAAEDPSIGKLLENPYSINPEGERSGPDVQDINSVIYDDDFKAWISPFVMAGINTRVVRRSHALQAYPYGKDFRYEEATLVGNGFSKKLTARGEGPSKEDRENGFYNIVLLGKLADGSTITTKVKGDKDPGYGSTSKMLGESAVCLAKDKLPAISGVLTPSTAMGDALLKRLKANAGLSFEVI